ncbi:Autophagy-related protein 8c, partial [Zea mays]
PLSTHLPVSPPLPWKTKKPSSTTNPIQLHPLRPVRFFPVLPSIDLALRRPGASSNRSGVCSVVGLGALQGQEQLAVFVRSVRTPNAVRFGRKERDGQDELVQAGAPPREEAI